MATMNILKSSFEGKLGETYGVKQHGKHFAKTIPFSHSPFTEKQKKAYSAFIILQRFAAGQWQAMKKTIRLENPKMLPQNIISRWYKPMIQGAFFNLENIYKVCDKLTTVEIITATYTPYEKKFTLEYTLADTSEKDIPQETMLTCFEQENYCLLSTQAEYGNNTLTFYTDREEITEPHFVFTQYKKKKKGWGVVGALAVDVEILTQNP